MQEGSSSSGQPQSGQAQQQSESGQRRDSAEGPREQGQQQRQEDGEQQGQQPGEQPQQQGEGDPKGDQPDRPGGKKDTGDAAAEGETGEGTRSGRDAEIWGNLPIHLRDIYRAEGRQDMPAQYRDWIDSYYRRLNDSGRD